MRVCITLFCCQNINTNNFIILSSETRVRGLLLTIEYLNIKRAQVQFLAKLSYTWEIVAYTWAHLVYEGLTLIPPGSA